MKISIIPIIVTFVFTGCDFGVYAPTPNKNCKPCNKWGFSDPDGCVSTSCSIETDLYMARGDTMILKASFQEPYCGKVNNVELRLEKPNLVWGIYDFNIEDHHSTSTQWYYHGKKFYKEVKIPINANVGQYFVTLSVYTNQNTKAYCRSQYNIID